MHWLLTYRVVDDYAARRAPFRDQHLQLAWEAHSRGELLLGGAVGDPPDSALLVFSGDTCAAAEAFAKNDPYVQHGLVREWTVRPWHTVAGERPSSPVHPDPPVPAIPAPGTRIGHVHLKVSDLEQALRFWNGILGLPITQRYGHQAVFLGVDGYHHHIGLNTWDSAGGSAPPRGTTGLFHAAILFPTRRALAQAVRRLLENNWPLDGAADHGVSEAVYLRDPDGNGVELTWDKPSEVWPYDSAGNLQMGTDPLDIDNLLAEAGAA